MVTERTRVDAATATALLQTLRQVTGRPDLEFADEPTVLSGGFYAELCRFTVADPPPELAGDLVARIVPDPAVGEWESTVQRAVAIQGFPTPSVRLTAPADAPLGRWLTVMDHVDGHPPLAGLSFTTLVRQLPTLVRELPDQLADMAARLHALDPEPLVRDAAGLRGAMATTIAGFVDAQVTRAEAFDRPDLAAVGRRLAATRPPSTHRVIAHGDLHPFNLLLTPAGPVLIDWTVALVAHPGFTIAFTELMLSNPPIPLPRAGAAALRPLARRMATRFLARYRATAPEAGQVSDDELAWHRKVHAYRILVELAGWDAAGTRPTSGHPWLVVEPIAQRLLGLRP